ncbi:MAG: hypothetical protein KDD82_30155, partial [Planctomycetes bacterium]|nr:hypothetical protein [Planctomycetota bacterium]
MNEIDLERLSLYLDGQLAQSDERALETRLARDGSLRAALDSLRVADRWLRDPETWSAGSHDALSARLSLPPVGEENAELGALRAAVEAYEDGSIPAASESLLQRVKARGTPSRSRSGRRRKASVRLVRRSGRLRLGSGSGSNRLPLRRASARISARERARRPSAAGRVSAAGRANPSAPWAAWAG